MLRWLLLIFIFVSSASIVLAQKKLTGRVLENGTRIGLGDVFIENLSNKQSTFTDVKGRFSIHAKTGDLLTFKGFAYQNDTVLVTDLNSKEVFMEPKKNELAQVNITSTEIKKLNTYDPQLHGQTMIYQRNENGSPKGGIILRMWYWKKDEKKKAKLEKQLKEFETADRIAAIFTVSNLAKYVPLTGEDMNNFIALYTPNVKTYTRNDFNLISYLNDNYKKYQALPLDKRKPNRLDAN
jgi:hypothetical protein